MTTTDPAGEARRWLKAASAPGRGALRLAAACQVLETMFTVVQSTALAWLAADLLTRGAHPRWPQMGLLLAGGLLAAAAAWGAGRGPGDRRAGRRRRRLPRPGRSAAPLRTRRDAAIFLITAVVQWPAAILLLLASLIVVPNLRLAGVFAKECADERVTATNRLAAVVLDSFRGMRTLQSLGATQRRRMQLDHAADRLDAATMATVRRAFLSGAIMDLVITLSIAVNATYIGLSLLGYVRLDAAPPVTLFNGLVALLLCPMYFAPLRATAAAYHARERAAAAAPRITALLSDTSPVHDGGRGVLFGGSPRPGRCRHGSAAVPGSVSRR